MDGIPKRGGRRPGAGRPGGPSQVVRLPLPLVAIAKRMKDGSLRAGDINAFLDVAPRSVAAVPLATTAAACGFPSPADDHMDAPLDFNELLVRNPAATFAVRISGESMRDRGLLPGDVAVVDRARAPVSGGIVLGLVGGEFTIKTYRLKAGGAVVLEAANPDFPDITIGETSDFEVWGVVTGIVRTF
ncbi:MAG: LexA family protein [Janthinobacterium lividum]